jgi:hypothetical protein
MKALLMSLLMLTGFAAHAADLASKLNRGVYKMEVADIGQIEIKVINEGHAYDVMTVSILCDNKRNTAVTSKWEIVTGLNEVEICYFREYNLNSKAKRLSVYYSMSTVPRQRPDEPLRPLGYACNNHVRTNIDLVKWCSPWR